MKFAFKHTKICRCGAMLIKRRRETLSQWQDRTQCHRCKRKTNPAGNYLDKNKREHMTATDWRIELFNRGLPPSYKL